MSLEQSVAGLPGLAWARRRGMHVLPSSYLALTALACWWVRFFATA